MASMAAATLAILVMAGVAMHAPAVVAVDVEAPTARDMVANDAARAGLAQAWRESFAGNGVFQSRGGWVYAHAADPARDMVVVLGNRDRSDGGGDMDLDHPEREGVPRGKPYVLVGDFHTHAGAGRPEGDDVARAYARGVPGIVVSCSGVYSFGPARRVSIHDGNVSPTYPDRSVPLPPSPTETRLSDNTLGSPAGACN